MSLKPYYQHGGITIYHGDCRDVLPTLGRFDLCLTDPPYGISFAAQPTKWQRLAGAAPMDWDDQTVDLSGVLLCADHHVIWGGNYYPLPPSRGWLVWQKPDSPPSMADFELAWTSRDMNAKWFSHSISATNKERVGHPTQKPVQVMSWCLSLFPGVHSVIDPFMGSGTSLVAAKERGLRAVGIDIEEKYCEIAAKRLAQENLFAEAAPA